MPRPKVQQGGMARTNDALSEARRAMSLPEMDATLVNLAGLDSSAGLVEQTAADTFTKRAIGVGAATSIPARSDADTRYAAAAHAHAHNDTTSLQGGAATEYYHLDAADHAAVAGARITKGTDTTDDLVVDDAAKGIVLKDSAGTPHYWRVTVDNTGALVTTDLGTTKP